MPLTEKSKQALQPDGWEYLDHGSYNIAYKTTTEVTVEDTDGNKYTGFLVRKEPCSDYPVSPQEEAMDDPARACRVFKEINAGAFCALYGKGAVYPYFPGTLNDRESAEALRLAYINSRRIVADAYVGGNLLRSASGRLQVADVGQALKKGSFRSDALLMVRPEVKQVPSGLESSNPLVDETLRALIYLETQLEPNQIKNKHITEVVLRKVAEYERKEMPITVKLLNKFTRIRESKRQKAAKQTHKSQPQNYREHIEAIVLRLKNELGINGENQSGYVRQLPPAHLKFNALTCFLGECQNSGSIVSIDIDDNDLRQKLGADRSAASKAAREFACFTVNTTLLLLCITVIGIAVAAPLFAIQRKKTGTTPFFFTKPRTLEQLEIAQTARRASA